MFPAYGVIWSVNNSYINVEKIGIIYKKVYIKTALGLYNANAANADTPDEGLIFPGRSRGDLPLGIHDK